MTGFGLLPCADLANPAGIGFQRDTANKSTAPARVVCALAPAPAPLIGASAPDRPPPAFELQGRADVGGQIRPCVALALPEFQDVLLMSLEQ